MEDSGRSLPSGLPLPRQACTGHNTSLSFFEMVWYHMRGRKWRSPPARHQKSGVPSCPEPGGPLCAGRPSRSDSWAGAHSRL